MNNWVDFKALRRSITFTAVLGHYGISLRRRGAQFHGYCPLPGHHGSRSSPSFSANDERGIFQCFGCGAKGNVLDFVVLMAGADPRDRNEFHRVVLDLQQCLERRHPRDTTPQDGKSDSKPSQVPHENVAEVTINAPLDFDLKGLDSAHPYLLNCGLTPQTVEYFGLGYCSRGFLRGRIAIPLHDMAGRLIGYAGRIIDESAIDEKHPKYLFPGTRRHDGKVYGFRNTLFVYNGHRLKAPVDDLFIVERFSAVWHLHQCGIPAAVALMGSQCSEAQLKQVLTISNSHTRMWLITNTNADGFTLARQLLPPLSQERHVRWLREDNHQNIMNRLDARTVDPR